MEITLQQLIGLHVYDLTQGREIGKVRGYLLDNKAKELVALTVGTKGLRKEECLLCLADAAGLSAEAVTVDSPAALRKKADCPHLKDLLKEPPAAEGLSVLKKDGTFLGRAAALWIETETGKVSRLELGRGSLLPLPGKTRPYLPAADIEIIGSDMILAKESAELHEEGTASAEIKAKAKSRTEPGCGEKIMAMSGKIPLPRRRQTVFPDIPKEPADKE